MVASALIDKVYLSSGSDPWTMKCATRLQAASVSNS